MINQRLNLIFDGDDTLWRNNVYFLQSARRIFNHFGLSKIISYKEYKKLLDNREAEYIAVHKKAYGKDEFKKVTFGFLKDLKIKNLSTSTIDKIIDQSFKNPPQIYSRARFILKVLSIDHNIYLFSKGHYREQMDKIKSLNLENCFKRVVIVKVKNKEAFNELVCKNQMEKHSTYVIGDSMRNDIIPAIEMGINAVYFDNPEAWSIEKEAAPRNISIINKLDDLIPLLENK